MNRTMMRIAMVTGCLWAVTAQAAETVPGVKVEYVHHKEPDKVFDTLHAPGIAYDGWTPLRKYMDWAKYPAAMRWSGLINIPQAGTYRFRFPFHHFGTFTLKIGDVTVPLTRQRTPGTDVMVSEGAGDLAAGTQPFSLYLDTTYPDKSYGVYEWAGPDGQWKSLARGPFTVAKWPDMRTRADDPLEKALREWRADKFGIFLCLSPWTGGRRSPYKWLEEESKGEPAQTFAAWKQRMERVLADYRLPDYDPRAWVEMIQDAGARYAIFTASHSYDVFCMYDTAVTKYKITNTPHRRDVSKDLADACAQKGLPLFFYCGPNYGTKNDGRMYTEEQCTTMARELTTKYGRIAGLWMDQGLPLVRGSVTELVETQPWMLMARGGRGDYDTPEFGLGAFSRTQPWERCSKLNKDNWFLTEFDYVENTVPVQGLIIMLTQVVGNGGNLVFNIPPNMRGGFDAGLKQVMKEMGVWMRANGEAIYGTEGGPYYHTTIVDGKPARPGSRTDPHHAVPWGASTCKGNTVYLHLLASPPKNVVDMYEMYAPPTWKGEALTLPALPGRKIVKASILGKPGAKVDVKMDGKTLTVSVPEASRDPISTIVVLELDKDAVAIEPINLWKGNP